MPDEIAVSRKEQVEDQTQEDPLVVETEDDWVEDDEGNFVKKGE